MSEQLTQTREEVAEPTFEELRELYVVTRVPAVDEESRQQIREAAGLNTYAGKKPTSIQRKRPSLRLYIDCADFE